MAYVIGGLIENEHYNGFVQQVVEVVNDIHQGGTSEAIANFGYGQPSVLKSVNDGDVVTALDWDTLITIIKNVAIYQDTTIPVLPTSIHTGYTIEIINDIQTAITAISTNRLNSENNYKLSTVNGGALRDIRVGGFTDLVYHEFFASFDSWDHARYFFNTGGQIKITPQFLTNSTSGINLTWKTIFNRTGEINFNHTQTTSGYTPTINVGFYDLTTTYQTIFVDSILPNNTLELQAKLGGEQGVTSNIYFKLLVNNPSATPELSTGRITHLVDVTNASSEYVTVKAPLFYNSVTMVQSSPPPLSSYPEVTISSSTTTFTERVRHTDREESGTPYTVNVTNINSMDIYDLVYNDPEYVTTIVNGVETTFKYVLDVVENIYKMVVTNKSGTVTFYRTTDCLDRYCFINSLDVQNSASPFKFKYITNTISGKSIVHNFEYSIDDNMFSWENPIFLGDYLGSPEVYYAISELSILDGGSGYTIGDILGLSGDGAFAQVVNVGLSNTITEIKLISSNPQYAVNDVLTVLSGSTGIDATFTVVSVTMAYNTTQPHYGAHTILFDNAKYVVAGAGENGFFVSRHNKNTGLLDQTFGINGVVTLAIGQYSGGVVTKIIKARDASHQYAVIGYCVINGNKRGFIALLNNDGSLCTQFTPSNYIGYYIEPDTYGPSIYYDVEIDNPTNGNSEYVVLLSRMKTAESLYQRRFTSINMVSTSDIYTNGDFGQIEWASFVKYQYNLGIVVTPDKEVVKNTGLQSAIIANLGVSTNNELGVPVQTITTVYDSIKTDIVETQVGDATISYAPIDIKLDSFDGTNGIYTATHSDQNGQLYIAQTYSIGNVNRISYGVKIQRFNSSANGYVIDESFANEYNSSNTWLSHVDKNATATPATNAEVFVPVKIFTSLTSINEQYIFVVGSYIKDVNVSPTKQDVQTFVMKLDINGNTAPIIKIYENGWSSKAMDAMLHSDILGNVPDTRVVMCGLHKATSTLNNALNNDLNSTPVDQGAFISKIYTVTSENFDELSYNTSFGLSGTVYMTTDDFVDNNTLKPYTAVTGSQLGTDVAMSGDGLFAVAGAKYKNRTDIVTTGGVSVFKRNDSGFYELIINLIPPTEITSSITDPEFGASVAMSDDASVILVGAPKCKYGTTERVGCVFPYVLTSENVWTCFPKFTIDSPETDMNFGISCDISGDGKKVVIGAPNATVSAKANAGKAFIYDFEYPLFPAITPSVSHTLDSIIFGDTLTISDANRVFGSTVCISSKNYKYLDGYTVIASKPQQTVSGKANAGAIDVFTSYSTDGSFVLDQTLYANTITENAYFGKHCELDHYGTTIFSSDGNAAAFTVNSLQYELKYYSATRDTLSKVRQIDIQSVDSTNTLIDLSCGHDGRTIAIGTSNVSTNQVEIYHRVGKDDPNLIIAGKYDEKYVYQSSLTTPTKFSPSDSSYSYGVVALSKYNNNLIVGSPNCDLTGNDRGDNDSLGKVYFYLAEDKKVDFTISGDINAIENNKEEYINFASGLITITKNKTELSYEEFSIDGVVFTLAHDEQYSIQETSVGYISIEKVDDVKREWRYFPKWNRYNYINGGPIDVNVELIYSTISYKLNRVTKSHTIAVIDGEIQQTDVYVSSTIDNCELITDYNEIIEKGTNYLYSGFIKYNEGSDRISYSILNLNTVDATDNILDSHSITLNGGSQPQQVTCGAIDVAIQPSINGVDNIYSFSFQAKRVPNTIDGTTNCIFSSSVDSFQMFNDGKLSSINCNPYYNAEKNVYDTSITSYRFYVEGTHNRDIISKIVIVGKFSGTPDEETVTTLYPSTLYDGYRKVGTKYLDDDTYSINLDYTMYNFYVDNDSERLLPDETYVVKVYTNQNIAKVFAGSYKLNDRIQGVNSNNIVYPIGSLSCRNELSPSSILEVFSSGESFPTILGSKFDLYFTPQNDANKKSKITFTMEGNHPRNYINNLNIFGVFGKGFDKGNEYRVPDRTDPKQRNYTYESYMQLFTDGVTNTKSSNSVQDSITSDVDPLTWVTVPPVVTCIAETYPLCTNYEYVNIGGYTKWEWDCSQFRNTYGPFVKGRMYDVSVNHVSDISYLEGTIAYKFENQKRGYISYYNENKIYNESETTSILKNDGFNGVKIDSVYTIDGTNSINPKIVIEMRGKLSQAFINKVVISGAFVIGPALVVDFSDHTYELTSTNNSEEGYIPQEYVPVFSNFYYKKVRDSINGKEFNEYVTVWEWEYTTSANASKDTGTFRVGQNYTIKINDGIIDALTFGDKQTSAVAVERLYQYNISSGGHDGDSYYGYVNDTDIDKPHTIGSSATNAMAIGDTKILSFTSSPTINWITGEVYGNVIYELQVEGTQAIDLFKTISIDPTGLTTATKMFNSKYSKQNASQPLILSTNTIVGKYNGGKYYGNALGIGLVRRRYQSTFTNQHTQLSDPKSISNKYTWDDSAVVRLFPSLNPVGDVCFLFESNKPFLHDFYVYEKNGKFRTVWQWVVGSPIYMPPTTFNANTIVPGKSMASGRTYKLTIDASDAASSTTTFGKTYTQKTSLMDSVTYGKEVYKPILFNTRSTNSSMSLDDRQIVSKFNIIANNNDGVHTWVNQVEGSINISPIINSKFGLKLEYMKLDQSNKSLEVKFSCTSTDLNIYGVIDRVALVNNGIEIYNGRLPTTSVTEDEINNVTISSDVNGRYLVAKMKVHEWVNVSDDYIDLVVVSNKDENYTFNYHVIDDNSNPLLTHNGAIKLNLVSKQTDSYQELVTDEVVSAINLKFFSYYSVVGEINTTQATDGYERYKYKLWYGIGPEDNVNDDVIAPPNNDWARRSFMNKPLPFTASDDFTFDIHTFPINGSEHIEYVIGAKGVITNDCITTISGQTSVSKHDSKVDFDETFRYRTGGVMPSKTGENKGVFRLAYVLFKLIKDWT